MICVCFSKIRQRRFLRDTRNDTRFLFWYPRFDTRADGLEPNHEGRHYRLSVSAGRDDFQTAQRQKKPACQRTGKRQRLQSMAGAAGCLPACRFGVLVQFCASVCLLVRGRPCLRAPPYRPHALKEGVRFCVGVDGRLRICRFFQKRCADVKFRVKQSGISPVGEIFAGNFITCLRQRLRGVCCCWRCYSTMGAVPLLRAC